jgi:heat shock protein HslJ
MSITIGARLETVVWSLDGVIPGTAITLQFLGGQVTGFSGCNSYNGGYTAVDNGDGTYSVTITGLTSTSAACPGDVMKQESGYMAILGSVTGAQVQGNVLTLNSPQGSLTYHQVGTPK